MTRFFSQGQVRTGRTEICICQISCFLSTKESDLRDAFEGRPNIRKLFFQFIDLGQLFSAKILLWQKLFFSPKMVLLKNNSIFGQLILLLAKKFGQKCFFSVKNYFFRQKCFFGQTLFLSAKNYFFRPKMFLFGQKCFFRSKMFFFGQKCFYFGQKLFISAKNYFFRSKIISFGQTMFFYLIGCIFRKSKYSPKIEIFTKNRQKFRLNFGKNRNKNYVFSSLSITIGSSFLKLFLSKKSQKITKKFNKYLLELKIRTILYKKWKTREYFEDEKKIKSDVDF